MKTPYLISSLIIMLCMSNCTDEPDAPVTCYLSTVTMVDPQNNIRTKVFLYNESNQLSKIEEGFTDRVYTYTLTGELIEEALNATGYCKLASKKFTYFNDKIVEDDGKATGPGTCTNADGFYGHKATYYFEEGKLTRKVKLKYQNFQIDSTIYMYTNGNITTEKIYSKPASTPDPYVLGQVITYEYDSKRNPWHIYKPLLTVEALSKNNIIKMYSRTRSAYDSDTYSEWTVMYSYTYTPEGYPLTRMGGFYDEQFEYLCKQ